MSPKKTITPTTFAEPSSEMGDVVSAAVAPDGTQIVVGQATGRLSVWDVATMRLLVEVDTANRGRMVLIYTPDGDRILAGGRVLAPLDARTLQRQTSEQRFRGHKGTPNALGWARKGDRLLSAGGSFGNTGDCFLRAWDARTGEVVAKYKLAARKHLAVLDLLVDPEDRWVASAGEDLLVRLHDPEDLAVLHTFEMPAPPPGFPTAFRSLASDPKGEQIAVSGSDGRVYLLDARAPEQGRWSEVAPPAMAKRRALESVSSDGLCFTPDGRMLVVPRVYTYEDGCVAALEVVDLATLQVRAKHATEATAYTSARLMPDGERLLTVGDMGVQLWPVRDLVSE